MWPKKKKRKEKKKIPFTTASKWIKYLGINITREVHTEESMQQANNLSKNKTKSNKQTNKTPAYTVSPWLTSENLDFGKVPTIPGNDQNGSLSQTIWLMLKSAFFPGAWNFVRHRAETAYVASPAVDWTVAPPKRYISTQNLWMWPLEKGSLQMLLS